VRPQLHNTLFTVTTLLLLLQSPFALAVTEMQQSSESGNGNTKIYPADFFAEAQLQTALDMLTRLPGFTLNSGDKDVRGFAGASGNVLINGQRPASKYDSLESILKRIKVSSVARIELIRGSAPGIDMQGQAVVANIIRTTAVTTERTLDLGLYQHADGRLMPEGQFDSSWQRDEGLLESSIKAYQQNEDDSGQGYRRRWNTSGQIIRDETSDVEADEKGLNATVGYERPAMGGDVRLNMLLLAERKEVNEDLEGHIPTNSSSNTHEDKDSHEAEFGMYFNRDLDSGKRFSLLAIQHLLDTNKLEQETDFLADSEFENDSRSGESVLRAVINQPFNTDMELEWGGEAAYNFLDSTSISTENDVVIPLPASSVKVQELRAEGFANVGWTVTEDFNLEAGMAIEFSTISQNGDTDTSKSLSYLKPNLRMNWNPTQYDQLRGSIQREVGQLDFADFVTSAELSTGTVDIGNPELVPDTAWKFAFTWERSFLTDSTAVLTLSRSYVSDVVDIVPIYVPIDGSSETLVFAGVGNIGDGEIYEAQLGLNLTFDQFGIQGGLLHADVIYRQSSVQDPLTAEQRPISEVVQPWEGNIEWTQDLPLHKFRWGAEITLGETEWQYRIDEVRKEHFETSFGLSAEYFPLPNWSILLELQNLASMKFGMEREIYNDPRDSGTIKAYEVQSWTSEPHAYLRFHWQLK
jgi:outer membrane receptor protein involved in Fe transport